MLYKRMIFSLRLLFRRRIVAANGLHVFLAVILPDEVVCARDFRAEIDEPKLTGVGFR
jgi:hypothetical protein